MQQVLQRIGELVKRSVAAAAAPARGWDGARDVWRETFAQGFILGGGRTSIGKNHREPALRDVPPDVAPVVRATVSLASVVLVSAGEGKQRTGVECVYFCVAQRCVCTGSMSDEEGALLVVPGRVTAHEVVNVVKPDLLPALGVVGVRVGHVCIGRRQQLVACRQASP